MVKNNLNVESDFANLLWAKAPALSAEETHSCYLAITRAIDAYLKVSAFQRDIDNPRIARKSLEQISTSLNSVINQLRMLDSTSQVHLARLGFKPRATETTLKHLLDLINQAKEEVQAQPDQASNDHLTYLIGRIHYLLGKSLAPHRKKSTKRLVNDTFTLIAPVLATSQNGSAMQSGRRTTRGIIPADIGRHFDKALKLKDIVSD